MTVAVLFCDAKGTYSQVEGVDLWGEERDARLYAGPHPVVAHPPCNLWINYAALNFKRWGGEHNRPGNDGGCFGAAVHAVCEYGGVLEHPMSSKAFAFFGLPRPAFGSWQKTTGRGWVTEVWQSAYGHKARKRTWLYYVGVNPPPPLNWIKVEGSHQCGWFDRIKPTLGKREASATPLAFAEVLLQIAGAARP